MATLNDLDWQKQRVQLILAILGAILTIVGWVRFAGV
jgi:hypothetical protein